MPPSKLEFYIFCIHNKMIWKSLGFRQPHQKMSNDRRMPCPRFAWSEPLKKHFQYLLSKILMFYQSVKIQVEIFLTDI
jgi:hypothetical protein